MAFADLPRRARDELVVQADLMAEVQAQLGPEIRRLEQYIRSLVPKDYPTPQVTVQAPVTVQAEAPEPPETAEISLTLLGVTELRGDIVKLTQVLLTPVVKTVRRDKDGYITEIIERRG